MLKEEIELNAVREALKAHCMCARLDEEADRIMVGFPEGFNIYGAQMRFRAERVSKTKAFQFLLITCEKYWVRG